MDLTDKEKKILEEGFLIKGFLEAFMKLLNGRRDAYAHRIQSAPKKTYDEQVMRLMVGNGGCLALNEFRNDIEQLYKVALEERPEPLS